MEANCSTCRFEKNGACRRFPPTLPADGGAFGAFPMVDLTGWCGEHQVEGDDQTKEWRRLMSEVELPTQRFPFPVVSARRYVIERCTYSILGEDTIAASGVIYTEKAEIKFYESLDEALFQRARLEKLAQTEEHSDDVLLVDYTVRDGDFFPKGHVYRVAGFSDLQVDHKISACGKNLTRYLDWPQRHLIKLHMEREDIRKELLCSFEVTALQELIANSELDWVDPKDTGDLTDAPMLGILGPDNDEGVPLVSQRWAYMDYQVSSFLEGLLDKGAATFIS